MKKRIITIITTIVFMLGVIAILSGCNGTTRSFGGSTTLELPANTKLEEITWKDTDIWYLTRPMTEDDVAETHTFQAKSEFGIFEGTVTVIEHRE